MENQISDIDLQSQQTDQNFLLALLDFSSDQIYFKDMQSRFIKVSKAVAIKHGLSEYDLIGKTDFDLFGPIHAQQAFDDEQQIINTRKPIIGKEEFEDSPSGKISWVTTSKMPLLDSNGNVIGTFGISRDITRRKRAENIREALFRISEAVFSDSNLYDICLQIHDVVSKLMLAKNFYIALVDDKKNMLSFPYYVDQFNPPQFNRIMGKGLAEYAIRIGEPLLVNSAKDMELRKSGEVLLEGTPIAIWLGVPLKVSGKTIGIIVVQDYENGNAYGEEEVRILTFVADQISRVIDSRNKTEKMKKYAEELKNLDEKKDKFLSIISHDLRGPLSGLLSFSELLLENYNLQSEQDKEFFIENVHSSVKNLIALVENLLTWARLQSNGIQIDQTTFNVSKVINSVFDTLKLVAMHKKINLEFDCPENIVLNADSNMIETVIRNLVSNSLKFTNEEGTVKINVSESENNILIIINDNGIGMSKDLAENLFRIDKTTSRDGTQMEKGTGLGLKICKEFVEKNGGSINIKSEIKMGTTVEIKFKPVNLSR